jgi:hypothetical protein
MVVKNSAQICNRPWLDRRRASGYVVQFDEKFSAAVRLFTKTRE